MFYTNAQQGQYDSPIGSHSHIIPSTCSNSSPRITLPAVGALPLDNQTPSIVQTSLPSRELIVGRMEDDCKTDASPRSATAVPSKSSSVTLSPANGSSRPMKAPVKNGTSSTSGRSGMSISLVNVVCNFKLRCHVNLRQLARGSVNAVHKPDKNIVEMELSRPKCSAKIYASGKVFAVGTTTETDALKAARRIARRVQVCGHKQAKFSGFRINNMMTTSWVPFAVRLGEIGELGPPYIFEPELGNRLHVLYKDIRTSVNVAPNGRITIFANSRSKVLEGLKRIYPILYKFRCHPAPSLTSAKASGSSANSNTNKDKDNKKPITNTLEHNSQDHSTDGGNSKAMERGSHSFPNQSPSTNPSSNPMRPLYQESSGINFAEAFVPRPVPSNTFAPLTLPNGGGLIESSSKTECFTSPTPSLSLSNILSREDLPSKKHGGDPLSDLDDIFDHLQSNNPIRHYGI